MAVITAIPLREILPKQKACEHFEAYIGGMCRNGCTHHMVCPDCKFHWSEPEAKKWTATIDMNRLQYECSICGFLYRVEV